MVNSPSGGGVRPRGSYLQAACEDDGSVGEAGYSVVAAVGGGVQAEAQHWPLAGASVPKTLALTLTLTLKP
eukprot:8275265-Pyramimonas_sp.AAC.2